MPDDDADLRDLLDQQIAYYRARAPEYDHWWQRTHQYELTGEFKTLWDAEVQELHEWFAALPITGDVLELACGTGTWTGMLAERAATVTALDASPEVMTINAAKPGRANVTFVEADLFAWEPATTYDAVFFGFWLSHVPPQLMDSFWRNVRRALKPGGVVAFVDNLWRASTDWPPEKPEGYVQERTDLSDGSAHNIVKLYFEADELAADLAGRGWATDIRHSRSFFLYGSLR